MVYIAFMPKKISVPWEYREVDKEVVLYKIDRESSDIKWWFRNEIGEAHDILLINFSSTEVDFDTTARVGDVYFFQGKKKIKGPCGRYFIKSFNKLDSRAHLPITPPK